MTESTELKPGNVAAYKIGDKTLMLRPIPYGRLKELLKIVFSAMDKFANMNNKDIFLKFPQIFEENLPKIMPLMFSEKEQPFMNAEWVDENMSLWDMRTIVERMVIINGLSDFLGKMGAGQNQAPKTKVEPALVK